MRAMVARNLTVGGKPTSLADLGFTDVGLDDNWQACGKGVNGSFTSFPDFAPLINPSFPDMKGMVDYGHSLGLSVGFYSESQRHPSRMRRASAFALLITLVCASVHPAPQLTPDALSTTTNFWPICAPSRPVNNCICKEIQSEFPGQDAVAGHMEGRVKYLAQCGFDGVKVSASTAVIFAARRCQCDQVRLSDTVDSRPPTLLNLCAHTARRMRRIPQPHVVEQPH